MRVKNDLTEWRASRSTLQSASAPPRRVKKLTISLFPRVAALTVVDTRRKADRIS
jgi:hypothetical protein